MSFFFESARVGGIMEGMPGGRPYGRGRGAGALKKPTGRAPVGGGGGGGCCERGMVAPHGRQRRPGRTATPPMFADRLSARGGCDACPAAEAEAATKAAWSEDAAEAAFSSAEAEAATKAA